MPLTLSTNAPHAERAERRFLAGPSTRRRELRVMHEKLDHLTQQQALATQQVIDALVTNASNLAPKQ